MRVKKSDLEHSLEVAREFYAIWFLSCTFAVYYRFHLSFAPESLSFFLGICDFGSATFTYDMRRLQEIMDFPKCWHKRGLFSRLFLGKEGTYATKSGAAAQAGDVTDGVNKVQST